MGPCRSLAGLLSAALLLGAGPAVVGLMDRVVSGVLGLVLVGALVLGVVVVVVVVVVIWRAARRD